MAQTGYTPIQFYVSTTASNVPLAADLANGEPAVNIADMALYFKNASGTVVRLINNPAGLKYPTADGTANQVIQTDGSGVLSFATAASGDVTLNGVQTLTNKTLTTPVVNGYTEGVVTANTGASYSINIDTAGLQILTLTANCTYTFPTATAGKSFTLFQKQDATGSRTVTWPASVKWPSSTAPTITSTASKGDKFVFTADGTYWWGSVAGQNYL